jgi:hypothetical protein
MNDQLNALTAQVAGLAEVQRTMLARLEEMAATQAVMGRELTENTKMTQTLRDATAFVRVGTTVLKWVGIVAIAVGSIVAGFKMALSGTVPPTEIGPKP